MSMSVHRNVCAFGAGFLTIENFASPEECSALKRRANELVDAFDPQEVTFFSSTNQVCFTWHVHPATRTLRRTRIEHVPARVSYAGGAKHAFAAHVSQACVCWRLLERASTHTTSQRWQSPCPVHPSRLQVCNRAVRVQEVTTNKYFLDSAGNISFFFEEGSFHPDGSLVQDKALSVNKCGHALHDLDPAFRAFSRSAKMHAIYRALGFRRPLPVQSMYIFKQPSIGGPVVPHQDRCACL